MESDRKKECCLEFMADTLKRLSIEELAVYKVLIDAGGEPIDEAEIASRVHQMALGLAAVEGEPTRKSTSG